MVEQGFVTGRRRLAEREVHKVVLADGPGVQGCSPV